MPTTSRRDTKATLRPTLIAQRRARSAARDRAADDACLSRYAVQLAERFALTAGDTVAAYEALGSEPPTTGSIAALSARGIRVIVPILLSDNDLDWCAADDDTRAPLGVDAITQARLVLTPALAADTDGTRLGRGGGSYDRALARCHRDARVLAVLHPGEIRDAPTAALPAEPHDA